MTAAIRSAIGRSPYQQTDEPAGPLLRGLEEPTCGHYQVRLPIERFDERRRKRVYTEMRTGQRAGDRTARVAGTASVHCDRDSAQEIVRSSDESCEGTGDHFVDRRRCAQGAELGCRSDRVTGRVDSERYTAQSCRDGVLVDEAHHFVDENFGRGRPLGEQQDSVGDSERPVDDLRFSVRDHAR